MSTTALDERWRDWPRTPATGCVRLLVARRGQGKHETLEQAELSVAGGLHGDRWSADSAPDGEGQITLMDVRVVSFLVGGDPARLHEPGDNLLVDMDIGEAALPVGARLRVGGATLEITGKPHAGCAKFRARLGDEALRWVNARANRGQRLRGVYARVIAGGVVRVGDAITRE